MSDPWAEFRGASTTADPWAEFRTAPQIDQRRGAPAGVRAMVGSLSKPEDRLAAIRRVYPDAQPYGDDNFLFTDPNTGRLTLYNERNPRIMWGMVPVPTSGDLASLAPEVAETIGGTMGATGGFMLGGPTGGVVGAGLGAAAGREIQNLLAQAFTGNRDTRSLAERSTDAALTAGMSSVGQRVGNLAETAIRARLTTPESARRAADFAQAGVTPSAGGISGSRGVQLGEVGLAASPGGAAVMAEAVERQVNDIARTTRGLARRYGQPGSPSESGRAVREAATAAMRRYDAQAERLYATAYNMVGADRPTPLQATDLYLSDLRGRISNAPQLREAYARALKEAEGIINGAPEADIGGQVTRFMRFDALREQRTAIGRLLKDRSAQGPSASVQPELAKLYGALTEDMHRIVAEAGPDAVRALRIAEANTRTFRTDVGPFLDQVLRQKSDDAVWRVVDRWSREDATALRRMRSALTNDEWNVLSATVLDRMGLSTPSTGVGTAVAEGAEAMTFSPATFITNWNRLSRNSDAKRLLFGGTQHQDLIPALDRLVRVVNNVQETARQANVSRTAQTAAQIGVIGSAGAAVFAGDPMALVSILGGGYVAPYVTARLMTNPRFVNWLAAATGAAERNPNAITNLLGRLNAVAANDPDMRMAVNQYREAVLSALPSMPQLLPPQVPGVPGRTGIAAPTATGTPQPTQ